ncbi:hypothetical protein C8Q76DRAFT_706340 [Earliella scabrosa]|nr:hypothetical protein C8Q76DRAFT_706340 [Earliella scabrosa]
MFSTRSLSPSMSAPRNCIHYRLVIRRIRRRMPSPSCEASINLNDDLLTRPPLPEPLPPPPRSLFPPPPLAPEPLPEPLSADLTPLALGQRTQLLDERDKLRVRRARRDRASEVYTHHPAVSRGRVWHGGTAEDRARCGRQRNRLAQVFRLGSRVGTGAELGGVQSSCGWVLLSVLRRQVRQRVAMLQWPCTRADLNASRNPVERGQVRVEGGGIGARAASRRHGPWAELGRSLATSSSRRANEGG